MTRQSVLALTFLCPFSQKPRADMWKHNPIDFMERDCCASMLSLLPAFPHWLDGTVVGDGLVLCKDKALLSFPTCPFPPQICDLFNEPDHTKESDAPLLPSNYGVEFRFPQSGINKILRACFVDWQLKRLEGAERCIWKLFNYHLNVRSIEGASS